MPKAAKKSTWEQNSGEQLFIFLKKFGQPCHILDVFTIQQKLLQMTKPFFTPFLSALFILT
jgi:hypothetical protein